MLIVEVPLMFGYRIDLGRNISGELCDLRMNSAELRRLESRKITANNFCYGYTVTLCEILYKSDLTCRQSNR